MERPANRVGEEHGRDACPTTVAMPQCVTLNFIFENTLKDSPRISTNAGVVRFALKSCASVSGKAVDETNVG
jgi:hypothetical protein